MGVKDWARRWFDALIPLPQGTSYNAYLVVGREATALVDTVNPGFEEVLWTKIAAVVDPATIAYVVMNHAEPDHAGALPWVLMRAPKAKVLLTEKGYAIATRLYSIPEERVRVIHEGETLDLGGKTLRFHEVPFVHWPETMFTYLLEDRILFPCDFFGAHTAKGFFAEGVPDIETLAKGYFGEILMPYRRAARRAWEKARELGPAAIAPGHGPIWQDPGPILAWYERWTAGWTEPKVLVAYVSMWGATARLVEAAVSVLSAAGLPVAVHDLGRLDFGRFSADLVESRALVLGTPTVLGGPHPWAAFALGLLRALKPPLRFALILSSHGWAGGAVGPLQEGLAGLGVELVGLVDVPGQPGDAEIQKARALAQELAGRVRSGGGT